MLRQLSLIALASALAATASAQCILTPYGNLAPTATGTPGYGDDFLYDPVPLNFPFPIGGTSATYTHAEICSNGFVYLTNGAASGQSNYGYPTDADFFGAAGSSPRIAAMWVDLESVPANGGGIYYNNSTPGVFTVTWSNVWEWNTTNPIFTVQAQIYANGDVIFSYSGNAGVSINQEVVTGISEGNGIAATPSIDLTTGTNIATTNAIFERQAAGVCDLGGKTLNFVFTNPGYVQISGNCQTAYNQAYGQGCYSISDSTYRFLADAANAPTLNGQSMSFTPAGAEYLVQWGGGTYVAPTGSATLLAVGDDGEVSLAPSVAMPSPIGPWSQFFIHGNGMVSYATNNGIQPINYVPDVNGFLSAPATAFFSWHDFNSAEAGSGRVKYEEAVLGAETIAYITWDDVENYPAGLTNRSTMQFQMNLTTGVVTIVWVTMDGDITSPFGTAHLIGYGPTGASIDGGNTDYATAAPFLQASANMAPIALTASPAPISTPSSGSNVVFTATDIPEYIPFSGVHIGAFIFSVGQLPGIDLGFLGAPGCAAYVASLDVIIGSVGLSTQSVTFPIPAGVPSGVQIFSQAISLITPGTLPNGQNAFGMTTSNGVLSLVAPF